MKTILLNLVACFALLGFISCDNYTVTGTCAEYRIPDDGQLSMRILDEKLDDRVLQTTKVNADGSFSFKGHVGEPCIIYITSSDENGSLTNHSMGILEEGNIVLNCEDYQTNRTFLDCQGSGTPTNDLIQSYYRDEREIFNRVKESEKIEDSDFFQTLYDYPSVKKHLLEFVEQNKMNRAGVFISLTYLYSNPSGITELPDEIQDNPLVKSFAEKF